MSPWHPPVSGGFKMHLKKDGNFSALLKQKPCWHSCHSVLANLDATPKLSPGTLAVLDWLCQLLSSVLLIEG